MSALNKEQTSSSSRPVALGQGLNMFAPHSNVADSADFESAELMLELRIALNQAETLIRMQEGRIRKLEDATLTDELTGLANRRGFSLAFKRELAMARRDADYDGVLVMIDIDDFKSVNSMWGRQTGDAYLRILAETLRDGVRANDMVARLDGNTFALLLTHMDEDMGVKRLAKLESVVGKKIALPEGSPLRASFGFAAYTGTSSANAVVQTAELRLYACKSGSKKLISVD